MSSPWKNNAFLNYVSSRTRLSQNRNTWHDGEKNSANYDRNQLITMIAKKSQKISNLSFCIIQQSTDANTR